MDRAVCTAVVAWPRITFAAAVALLTALPACSVGTDGSGTSARPGAAVTPAERVSGPRSYLYLVPASGGAPRALLNPSQAARAVAGFDPPLAPYRPEHAVHAGGPA